MIRDLQQIAIRLRRRVPPIHDEVTSRANSTPILLPIRNFKSGHLADMLRLLEADILGSVNGKVLVARHLKEFGRHHPDRFLHGREQDQPREAPVAITFRLRATSGERRDSL